MHSLLCRLHLNDSSRVRSHSGASFADDVEDTSRLNERPQQPPAQHQADTLGRSCTGAHVEALRLLSEIAGSLATRPSNAAPDRLFAPDMLALLGDLLEMRHDAPRLPTRIERDERCRRLAGDVILLFSHVLSQGFRSSEEVLTALTTHHGGRAPFLLRLASAAVQDLPLSMAMCELLTEFSHAIGRPALIEALLALDSATDVRTDAAPPCGMKARCTSFLDRLIGDGPGERGNDGAVYAIGRLHDEGLLPDRSQVVHWRSHWRSRRRWEKQERFVQCCKDLRCRTRWQPPARPALSFEAMSGRLAAMLGELTGRSRGESASAACGERRVDSERARRIAALSTDGSCLDRSPRPSGPHDRP